MNKPAKPAHVRYYLDADVLGLAKILVQLRTDMTYPGDPGGPASGRMRARCPISEPATPDEIWIPLVARQHWLIITRDRRIQDHRAEIDAVISSSARMIVISSPDAVTTFDQLEVLMCNWRAIERLLDDVGPFIYTATRTGGLNRLPLGF